MPFRWSCSCPQDVPEKPAADIRENRTKSKSQAWGYACMMLQPYISMDGICAVLLSDAEKEELRRIAEQTTAAFARLGDILQSDMENPDELPATLMEIYIQRL